MARRITSLLAVSTLVGGLLVGVSPAQALRPERGPVDTGGTTATTAQPVQDPQKLAALLSQLQTEVKQAQHSKAQPGDLGGPTGLLTQLEATVLALLSSLTSALGLPPVTGLPGGAPGLPATQLERQLRSVQQSLAQTAPGDLGSPTGLLTQLEAVVLALLNSLTSALGLPPLPGLPGAPGLPPVPTPPVPGP